MKYLRVLFSLYLLSQISACGSEASETAFADIPEKNKGELTCLGFHSPKINVFVKNSMDSDLQIDNATVKVIIRNNENDDHVFKYAYLLPRDDRTPPAEQGAYSAYLEGNTMDYKIDFAVLVEGYHSFVTKDISFRVNSTCMAENTLNYTVYLCPMGSACL